MSLKGCFTPAGDKSVSHRIALFSLLAQGSTVVTNYSPGEDCHSSLKAVERLGCAVSKNPDGTISITGAGGIVTKQAEIDCGNSGTTIRLLMGILSSLEGSFTLDGDKYLRKRPMQRIATPLEKMGAQITTTDGNAPIKITGGKLSGTEYELPVASAQLKSAVLLAGLNASSPTTVIEPVKSRDHTELMLKSFGAAIKSEPGRITVEPSALSLPKDFYVPGDPSSAAFFLCAATMIKDSEVTARGILLNPTRALFIDVLKRMGADVTINKRGDVPEPWGDITVRYNGRLKACTITAEEVPSLVDEIPILTLVAALAEGESVFHNVGELRIKETDRLVAVRNELGKMGACIYIDDHDDDCKLVISDVEELCAPEELDSYGDHRMAMTLRLALLIAGAECEIEEEECVAVSYPAFHEDLKKLLG